MIRKGFIMKEFQGIIKKKGIQKIIHYFIYIFVLFIPILVFHQQILGDLKGTCTATSFEELNSCQKQKRFTKIKTKNIYDVGYNYVVDGKVVGKFLDIDLDGNVIVALADVATADELLNQTGEREISGNFSSFDSKLLKETLKKIQDDYIGRFSNDASIITEEQTREMFFGYLLNQYDGKNFSYIFPVILVVIIILLLLFKVIEGFKMIFAPEKTIIYGRKTLNSEENVEKASFEFYHGPYLFQNKNIRITNNYIFDLRGYGFTYHKINEAIWMYEKGIKHYGIIETGKQLIIKFKDTVTYILPLTLSERKKMMEILRVKNPGIIKGYSQEAGKQYQQTIAETKNHEY